MPENANQALIIQRLRESEARFRSIFEGGAIGIAILDLNGNFLLANPSLGESLAYQPSDFLSRSLEDLIVEEHHERFMEIFTELASGKRDLFRHEARLVDSGGKQVWFSLTLSLTRKLNGNPSFIILLADDISYRKKIEAELNEVKRRIVASRERERLRLAQDLHDAPIQELYGILYQLEGINLAEDPEELKKEIDSSKQAVINVIGSLRRLTYELRPPTLGQFGLEGALREHADHFSEKYPEFNLTLSLDYDGKLLDDELRITLFRIYQQALMNIVRHAQAKNITIRFYLDETWATLEIKDDGRGFSVPLRWIDLTRENHLGLAGAAERAELVGGKLDVYSSPGQGTTVRVRVPLDSIHQD